MSARRTAPPTAAAWTGLALGLLALALGGPAPAAVMAVGIEAVRPGDGLNLPGAPALAQHAPTLGAIGARTAGSRSGGGAPPTPTYGAGIPSAATPSTQAARPAARPEGDSRRALQRAGRLGAPATAPPFLSF